MNTLRDYYYWNDRLPDKSDKTLKPDAYFNSIMYWYDPATAPDGDRFSWIEKDYTLLNKALNDILGTQTLPLVQMRAETIQTDRLLSLPGKRIRGMQLDNLPFFK